MSMKRCNNGHFFDDAKYNTCPYCGISNMDTSRTMPIPQKQPPTPQRNASPAPAGDKTIPIYQTPVSPDAKPAKPPVAPKPVPPTPPQPKPTPVTPTPVAVQPSNLDNNKTVFIPKEKHGFDPIVGWVVCIDGPDKGKSYAIKMERNYIGRSSSMDIAIQNDASISRENHLCISYNPKNNSFTLIPGEKRGIVYLNENELYSHQELKQNDVIELGQTKLMFVPFCNDKFKW